MEITLKGTRTHDNKTFNFEECSLTLLDGRNGAGKSTLLDAIYWCLYGKIQDLYKGKCQVIIQMSIGRIERSTVPNHLIFDTKEGRHFEDDEAQLAINAIFGEKLIFDSSSYLKQNTNCYLLTATPGRRMDVLNEMTFTYKSQTPKHYLEVIERKEKETKHELTKAESSYTTALDIHKQHEFIPTIQEVITDPEEVCIEKEILMREKLEEKKRLMREITENKSKEDAISTLQKRIDKIITKIDGRKLDDISILEEKQAQLQEKLTKTETMTENKKKTLKLIEQTKSVIIADKKKYEEYQDLSAQLDAYSDMPVYQTKELRYLEQRWRDYNNQQRILGKFPNIHTKEDLEQSIQVLKKRYQEIIKTEQYMKIYDEYKKLRAERNNINKQIEVMVSSEEIQNLENSLQRMETSRNVHICPNCSVSLRLKENKLVLSKTRPSTKKQINELKEEIKFLKTQKELQRKKSEYEKKLLVLKEKLPSDLVYDKNIEESKEKCIKKQTLLESIDYIDKPDIPEEEINNIKSYLDLKNKISIIKIDTLSKRLKGNEKSLFALQSELSTYETNVSVSELKAKLKEVVDRLNETRRVNVLIDQKNELEKELYDAPKPKKLSILEELLEQVKEDIRKAKKYIKEYNNYTRQEERNANIRKIRKKKDKLSDKYKNLLELKKIASDLECYLIQNTVDELNVLANKILDDIYHGDMQAELTLFKEIKSKSKLKNEVTLHVIQGSDRRPFKKTSGGEKQIVSFVFVVALCLLNPSPLLMIDEALSEVDEEFRPICISALRKYSEMFGKTAIIVNHNDTEGDYDQTQIIG